VRTDQVRPQTDGGIAFFKRSLMLVNPYQGLCLLKMALRHHQVGRLGCCL
jgi:hypothetical protein